MANYAVVIKACSKIVCHALSRIKTRTMLWLLFSGFTGLFTVYLYLFFVRQALLGYLFSIYTQFFPVRTITQCKFHSKPQASKGLIGIFDHIFHGYSNRQFYFPHINIAHIVSWTSDHATYDVYSPEVVETLIHGQCYGYCFLYCV